MTDNILEIKNLKIYFDTLEGTVKAVDGVSVELKEGETLGIVGESGSGKTVLALSILRLIPAPPGKIVSGEIIFDSKDLIKQPLNELRKIRGNKIAMIFQDPMTCLNPVYTIKRQILENIRLHTNLDHKTAVRLAIKLLRQVGIPNSEERIKSYPHQLSGGMRQRVMIAMALTCNPKY